MSSSLSVNARTLTTNLALGISAGSSTVCDTLWGPFLTGHEMDALALRLG